jgi:RimJ/RimL family protein N-acetyltransferase
MPLDDFRCPTPGRALYFASMDSHSKPTSHERSEEQRIETTRLLVRSFRRGDWRDLHEYLSQPAVLEYEPGGPSNESECKEMAAERSRGSDFWAACLKPGGKMIGHVYFSQTEPAELLTWEIGYIFNPAYGNHGYATEACRALLDYGFGELGAHRVVGMCDPRNAPSWRLLERLSMRREGHFGQPVFFRRKDVGEPLWHDAYQYALLAEEWEKLSSTSD